MTSGKEYRLRQFTSFDDLIASEAPVPKVKSFEVCIRVHAVSLNYRDVIIAKGLYPFGVKDNIIPCSDGAGEVVEVGEDVHWFKKGDRVCGIFTQTHLYGIPAPRDLSLALGGSTDGMLTQYRVLPETGVVKFPEHMSYEEAATLPCAAVTAYNALYGLKPLRAGQSVLVQGTGGVSIIALQLAKAAGALCIATSSSNEKLQFARELGADHVINYKETPNWGEKAKELTKTGVDHVIEIGGAGTMEQSFKAIKADGVISVIGFLAQKDAESKIPAAHEALGAHAIVRGLIVGSRQQFEDLNAHLSMNKIKPVIDKVFAFEQAKEAYQYLWDQKHIGKVVIQV